VFDISAYIHDNSDVYCDYTGTAILIEPLGRSNAGPWGLILKDNAHAT
jgi:hypothetical protein